MELMPLVHGAGERAETRGDPAGSCVLIGVCSFCFELVHQRLQLLPHFTALTHAPGQTIRGGRHLLDEVLARLLIQ